MKELLETMRNEGYPLTTISKHAGVAYGKLYRCWKGLVELRTDDALAVKLYAKKLGVK